MGSTNYRNTFIQVAADCPVLVAQTPPATAKGPTIASLLHQYLTENPYRFTSDDVVFLVHAEREGIPPEEHDEARESFFARPQACLRSSALGKRYGWGIHHDDEGRVALVPLESDEYRRLSEDPGTVRTAAMRSRRR